MSNSISVQEVQDVPLQKLLQICKNKFSNLKLGLTENNKKLILKNDKSRLQKITLMTPQETLRYTMSTSFTTCIIY